MLPNNVNQIILSEYKDFINEICNWDTLETFSPSHFYQTQLL